jgi:hypothetical protein
MKKNKIEDFITLALESEHFEDLLEKFDLTPQEVFTILYDNGHIDEDVLVTLSDVYDD